MAEHLPDGFNLWYGKKEGAEERWREGERGIRGMERTKKVGREKGRKEGK